MKYVLVLLIILLSSCITTDNIGIRTEILAKCIANNGSEAKFESNNPNYSEIIITGHAKKYKVGREYVLILRKN